MNQYTLWQYRSKYWHRMGVVVAESAERALEMQGGSSNPLPQCITDGSDSHPSTASILAGYNP